MGAMSVTELRANLRRALARVEAGEVLQVTRDGEVVAALVHPSQLRHRIRTPALIAAEELHRDLDRMRGQPLGPGAMSPERADELVREIRAGRARRRR